MLTYLINVTDDMLALSLLTGMVLAFLDTFCRSSGRLIGRLGLLAGFIAAAEKYADKVMGQVEKAIGVADKLENSGKLGDISQLCLYDNGVSLLLTAKCAGLSV